MRTRAIKGLSKRVAKWHTSTVILMRATDTVGEYGEQLNEFGTVVTTTGRVIGLRKKDYEDYAGQEGATTMYRVSLPVGTDIRAGDRVQVATEEFDVVGLDNQLTDRPDVQALIALRQ